MLRSDAAMLVVVSVVVLGSLLAGVEACPVGFEEIEGECYAFRSDVLATWEQAETVCCNMTDTSFLASITSGDTHRAVYEYIMAFGLEGSFWLGGSDLDYEGDWVWRDSTRVPRGTPYWSVISGVLGWSQEPDGGIEENCLALDKERLYYFNDVDCGRFLHPICQN